MNVEKVVGGIFLLILSLVLFVGIPFGPYIITLKHPILIFILIPLALYQIVKGLLERPEEKALEQVKERITEIVKEFIHKKTDNIAVQQMFLRDLTEYIKTQDLENFFGKPKNGVIDAFLNDRNKFESLMNEALERFWRQWSREINKTYIN